MPTLDNLIIWLIHFIDYAIKHWYLLAVLSFICFWPYRHKLFKGKSLNYLVRQVHPTTKARVLSAYLGDKERVGRLIAHSRSKYPGKTEQWYWEKVLRDLERDRR